MNVPHITIPQSSNIVFKYYVVAFFDILGQKSHLSKMCLLPDSENELEEFSNKAKSTLGAIYLFRNLFNEYFSSYITATPPDLISELPSTKREEILNSSDIEIYFQGFSDTLIVYSPLVNGKGSYQWRAVHSIFSSCSLLMPTLLSMGIPIRGAIDYGVGCEFVPNEIYGPVLQSAYHLESEVADYPRIVVGDSFLHLIEHGAPKSHIADIPDKTLRSLYDKHAYWIENDLDGTPIIDYLGISAQRLLGESSKEKIGKAYNYICSALEYFSAENNDKLMAKYSLLKKYYDSRIIHNEEKR